MIGLDEAAATMSADVGAKARVLSRALHAGLSVPPGFVVLPDEEIDEKEIARRLAQLGGERFAVRSSANLEDRPGASAAGVFGSFLDVAAAGVSGAVARVRETAHGGAARAYLGARGLGAARVRMAVLVQPMVRGRTGVLHTEPIEDGALLAEERAAGEPEWGEVEPRRVPLGAPLSAGALSLARLVGAAADVEYAEAEAGPVFLQARPLTGRRGMEGRRDASRFVLAPSEARGRTWLRDTEHNPAPLSRAQASLVELLDRVPGVPAQRVLAGYLYYEARAVAGTSPGAIAAADLPARFSEVVEPACDALLAPLEAAGPGAALLDEALAIYAQVVARYLVEVSPVIAAARRTLDDLLQRSMGARLADHGALLSGTGGRTLARDGALRAIGLAAGDERLRRALTASYRARFGAYAPAWDVAVAPDDEAEARVAQAAEVLARGVAPEARHREALEAAEAEARRVADRMGPADRAAFLALLPSVRGAMEIAEDDDALFFRAQRLVRRPLLAQGALDAARGRLEAAWQIFNLSVDDVRRGAVDAGLAHRNRALREAAGRLDPPVAIRDGVPSWRGGGGGAILAGRGTAGRAYGRAFVVGESAALAPGDTPPAGAVLVMSAVLPSLTWLLPGAAALVTDWGGALSHGATLAREYGVPAVLGTGQATRRIRGGEELLVDADAGRVYRLGGG